MLRPEEVGSGCYYFHPTDGLVLLQNRPSRTLNAGFDI